MTQTIRISTTLAALLVATSCASQGTVDELRKELDLLRTEQGKLATRLDTLEKRGDSKQGKARPNPPSGPDLDTVYALTVDDSPQRGPADAWVTIVEFSDFECPFCRRVQGTLDELHEQYGEDLRVVFKHNPLPFHPKAMPAAIAAICAAEQERFWPLQKLLFEKARDLDEAGIETLARQAGGIDIERFTACRDNPETAKRVELDQQLAARFGARGTPAFFINGRFLSGAQPLESFRRVIDEELDKARKSGIARGDYYETTVEKNGKQEQ